jgi:hypothetical protein
VSRNPAAGRLIGLAAAAVLSVPLAAACRKIDPPKLDAVRGLRRLVPRFTPPVNGELTPAQLDLYLRVRRAGRHGSDIEAARALGIDAVEYVWVRGRVLEALAYLDTRRVQDGAAEAFTRSAAVLREARKESRDPKTSSRLDAEIAAADRERSAARRADPALAAGAVNAPKVAARRAEIDAVAQ